MKALFSAVMLIALGAASGAAAELPAEFNLAGVTAESLKDGEMTCPAVPAIPEASAPSVSSAELEAGTKAGDYSDSAIPGILMPFFAWYHSSPAAPATAGAPSRPVQFVSIPGGRFTMGTGGGNKYFEDARPVRTVAVRTFQMSKTAVTVEQYAECVLNGWCSEPGTGSYCNWGLKDRKFHPVNCVSWTQANRYVEFKNTQRGFESVRLPTEAEWEYAAKSGGRDQKYPWGNEEATCDRAVMADGQGAAGCGKNRTMPVCSKPYGNTVQGLCDMAGNVRQWVRDTYQRSYNGAPVDGSAFEGAGAGRVARGGSFFTSAGSRLRADCRYSYDSINYDYEIGFRLAR